MPRSIHCRDICVCDRKIILRNSTAFNFTDYVICCDKQRSAVGVGGDRRHEVLAQLHADLRRICGGARIRHRAQMTRGAALSDRADLDQHVLGMPRSY
jgi:hypothetical protein